MDFNVMDILFDCAVILLATKLLGLLSRRLGLPQVVGMIIAGLLIGPAIIGQFHPGGFMGIIHPTDAEMDVLQSFSQIGVVFILFSSGLETDFRELKRSGAASSAIAMMGAGGAGNGRGFAVYGLAGKSGEPWHAYECPVCGKYPGGYKRRDYGGNTPGAGKAEHTCGNHYFERGDH